MNAIDFIKEHNKVMFWNIYRYNEGTAEWDFVDKAEIEEEEKVDDAFFSSALEENDTCDLYLA